MWQCRSSDVIHIPRGFHGGIPSRCLGVSKVHCPTEEALIKFRLTFRSEVLPLKLRQRGSSVSTACNWIFNFMIVYVSQLHPPDNTDSQADSCADNPTGNPKYWI